MPAMLIYPGNRGWPAFQGLLRGLLRFLEPYLRNAQLTEAIRLLYKVRLLPRRQVLLSFQSRNIPGQSCCASWSPAPATRSSPRPSDCCKVCA